MLTFQCSDAVLPEQPTEVEADWTCSYCGCDYSVEYVSKALMNAEKALKDSNDNEDIIQHYERYIKSKEMTAFYIYLLHL